MGIRFKLRDKTTEVLVVPDSEDNPTGYRLSVHFKREAVNSRDQIVLEAPKLLGEDRIYFTVYDEGNGLILRSGDFCPHLTISKFYIALALIQKHEAEIIKALND